jgi:hypothetical protein
VQEWWSVIQFVLAVVLLLANGAAEPVSRWKPYWFTLAAIFAFLSIDEAAGFHELLVGGLPPFESHGLSPTRFGV